MAILDWVKEIPLSAIYKERLVDSEKQISVLEREVVNLGAKVANLEQEKVELQSRLEKSEQDQRTLEEQIKKELAEGHSLILAFNANTGTWFDASSSVHYCANCKASGSLSPMKNESYGWRCPACKRFWPDPERPKPKQTQSHYPSKGLGKDSWMER